MKNILLCMLLFCSYSGFAQTVTQKIVASNDQSAEAQKARAAIAAITDKNIYDDEGNVIDSVTAVNLLKTYEYNSHFGIPKGQTGLKHMVSKIDTEKQAKIDYYSKSINRPKSPKLWEGTVLDLKPLAGHTDVDKLQGKAVILIFWFSIPRRDIYAGVNDVIVKYLDTNKFEVFAITFHSYDVAKSALKNNSILNAHLIVDAQAITDAYETENRPIIVVTNAQHQITYSITNYAAMTPRIMNGLLKNL